MAKAPRTTLTFLGAAGTVTGSKYLLQVGDRRVLVDSGLFQGEKKWRLLNWGAVPGRPRVDLRHRGDPRAPRPRGHGEVVLLDTDGVPHAGAGTRTQAPEARPRRAPEGPAARRPTRPAGADGVELGWFGHGPLPTHPLPADALRYRLLTGTDEADLSRRISEALADGYALAGAPALAFDGERVVVGQAVVWAGPVEPSAPGGPAEGAVTDSPARARVRTLGSSPCLTHLWAHPPSSRPRRPAS